MKSSKFYAVKYGRKTGVFNMWNECQKQVSGYSKASFRSFNTKEEAERWLKCEKEVLKEGCHIYTDGSHQRSKNFLGLGAWCRWEDCEYFLSLKCDADLLKDYDIDDVNCSNPTAEFLAFAEVLKRVKSCSNVNFIFHCDYEGVEKWMNGDWEAKESYIKKIKKRCKEIIGSNNLKVDIVWVKGHSGNEGNNNADKMAGMEEEFNTFDQLVKILKHH